MTVIAANLKEMAADTLVGLDGGHNYYATKIFRLDDGSIIGAAGRGPSLELVMEWLKQGEIRGNEPALDRPDFLILRLRRDGLYLYADSCIGEKMRVKNFSIGTGSDIALYAMRVLKKPPVIAVREACKIAQGCGGPIDRLVLER
jgi:hypothetical protein